MRAADRTFFLYRQCIGILLFFLAKQFLYYYKYYQFHICFQPPLLSKRVQASDRVLLSPRSAPVAARLCHSIPIPPTYCSEDHNRGFRQRLSILQCQKWVITNVKLASLKCIQDTLQPHVLCASLQLSHHSSIAFQVLKCRYIQQEILHVSSSVSSSSPPLNKNSPQNKSLKNPNQKF